VKAWTDYPLEWMGDEPGKKAPVREVDVLSYDGNKRCRAVVGGRECEIKAGYIYQRAGRIGEVPALTRGQLSALPRRAEWCR
jgi:hypothetical protein